MKKLICICVLAFLFINLSAQEIGYIIRIDNENIFIDKGREHFVKEGDYFGVYKKFSKDYFAIIKVLESYQESALTKNIFTNEDYKVTVPDIIQKIDKSQIRENFDNVKKKKNNLLYLFGGSILTIASGVFAYKGINDDSNKTTWFIASSTSGILGVTLLVYYF